MGKTNALLEFPAMNDVPNLQFKKTKKAQTPRPNRSWRVTLIHSDTCVQRDSAVARIVVKHCFTIIIIDAALCAQRII